MNVQELKTKLEGYRPSILVSGKEIDKNDENVKDFIELYYQLTGKRVGEGTCRNCIFDAYMELSIKTDKQLKQLVMPSKYKMRKGRLVVFNNTDYSNANMTDEVALAMVNFNIKHAGNFLNGDELLSDYKLKKKVKAKKVVSEVESSVKVDETEPESAELPTLDEIKALYKEKKGKKPHWKWSYDTILEKLNED
jgi:hypothetical protein